ncbi:MAG: winged helix-turn-helix transcriptional regulator [Candidatus Thorarchaeota archaeon]|nr:winged helix-turn-helix transcriptional regulator [Candidatus Thorarchaeota archaeon]
MEDPSTRIGLVAGLEASILEDAKEVANILSERGIQLEVEQKTGAALRKPGLPLKKMQVDSLIVVGSDKFLLSTLLNLGEVQIPILPVSSKGQPDFLFDVTATNFETAVDDLLENRWTQEKKSRICAEIDGKTSPPLLNDVGIFARRSATLLRYSLFLDGERFWKDGSDGLIVATPTGSTAYSLSVGGPVILSPASVISIIPVNSVNPARRPLIVSDEVTIEVRDLESSVSVELVFDGQIRKKTDGRSVTIRKAEIDATFVKFSEERLEDLRGKLSQKTEAFGDLAQELPPSAKLVLKVLEYQGQLTQKEIIEETMLPARTVRYALSLLISEGLIKKHISLRDSRQGIYSVTKKKPIRKQPK